MENDSKFTPPKGNPLYTHAELAVMACDLRQAVGVMQ